MLYEVITRHGAHEKQVVAERRRHVGDLRRDRVENAVPDQVEAEVVSYNFV